MTAQHDGTAAAGDTAAENGRATVSGFGFVLGVDFGGTKTALATATPDGRVLRQARHRTDAATGARDVLARAVAACRELVAATAAETGGRLAAVGVVSPGVIGETNIRFAPNIPGWERLALRAEFRDALGVGAVACANDVKAAGAAEARWGTLRGADPGLYLSLGTGVGVALVVGGTVVTGANGAAGEIGYQLLGTGDHDGVAAGRAPLEEYAGGVGLVTRGGELLGRPVSGGELFGSREPRVVALVDGALDVLATHVANLVIAFDPARVAVGGGLMASAERVMPVLAGRLRQAVPFPPELVVARFPHDAALHGALALACQEYARHGQS